MPERDRADICADLEALTQQPGFAYSLATIALHDLFFDPAEAADINWYERLSYQEPLPVPCRVSWSCVLLV